MRAIGSDKQAAAAADVEKAAILASGLSPFGSRPKWVAT
jgi:hypothetical protein